MSVVIMLIGNDNDDDKADLMVLYRIRINGSDK